MSVDGRAVDGNVILPVGDGAEHLVEVGSVSSCGYFDDERREYVIRTPKTPVRWINYIGTRSFGGFVDQTGAGGDLQG